MAINLHNIDFEGLAVQYAAWKEFLGAQYVERVGHLYISKAVLEKHWADGTLPTVGDFEPDVLISTFLAIALANFVLFLFTKPGSGLVSYVVHMVLISIVLLFLLCVVFVMPMMISFYTARAAKYALMFVLTSEHTKPHIDAAWAAASPQLASAQALVSPHLAKASAMSAEIAPYFQWFLGPFHTHMDPVFVAMKETAELIWSLL